MSNANDRQVGGTHYKGAALQHWDWVGELGLTYLEGCATKYVIRARKKNGAEDLAKARHYLEKLKEVAAQRPQPHTADNALRGATANTYIARARNSSGTEDLAKAEYYMEKSKDVAEPRPQPFRQAYALLGVTAMGFAPDTEEYLIVSQILERSYEQAITCIVELEARL